MVMMIEEKKKGREEQDNLLPRPFRTTKSRQFLATWLEPLNVIVVRYIVTLFVNFI